MQKILHYILSFIIGAGIGYLFFWLFDGWGWTATPFAIIIAFFIIGWLDERGDSVDFYEEDEEPESKKLGDWTLGELRDECAELNIKGYGTMTKDELIHAICKHDFENEFTPDEMRKHLKSRGLEADGLTRKEMIDLNNAYDNDEEDYENYTLEYLKELCDENKIGYKSGSGKDELVKLLEKHDL